MYRGEVPEDEDLAEFNPTYLKQRKPSLVFMCLLAILDPPREEVIEAVKVAHQAGISVKMITGVCGKGVAAGGDIHPPREKGIEAVKVPASASK